MQAVSQEFLAALSSAHGVVTQVDILYGDTVVAEDIPFTDGSVSVDRGSDVRRSLSLTVPDPRVFPHLETDPYAPYGQRIRVRSGIRHLSGAVELVDVGFFVIASIEGDLHYGPMSIDAPGLESLVQAEPFITATSTDNTSTVASFIQTQLTLVSPDFDLVDATDGAGTSSLPQATWEADADRWAALQKVARSVGCELFVNAQGSFVISDIPDPLADPPVWTVAAGEGGVMVEAVRGLTSDGVHNRVIVRGENASEGTPPVSGEATITDPNDPLRYGGPFGRRTLTYRSDLIVDDIQASSTANALLRLYRAPNSTLSLSSVPNPALDVGDVIRVVYANGDPPELHVVQAFDLPLSVGGTFTVETVSGREEVPQ